MSVWLPLQGEHGDRPKAPSVSGWQSEGYAGVDKDAEGWIGLRCDGLVVVDCDSMDAARAWAKRIGTTTKTWTRKTPRGYHFIYTWTPGSPTGPMVGVFPGTDIRAGRTSQIVFKAPGYRDFEADMGGPLPIRFDPQWLPAQRELLSRSGEEWDEVPEGRGNNTMTAIAGALRRQGMSEETMYKILHGVNKLTMTRDPMPPDMIASIVHSVGRYTPDPDIDIEVIDDEEFDPAKEFDAESNWLDSSTMSLRPPQVWWWQDYVPKGKLTLVEGAESIGKGMFAVWLAIKMVSGDPFPDGERRSPQPVVWFSAEDDPEEDILRRLYAAGYDQARHAKVWFYNPRRAPWKFPQQADTLRKLIAKSGAALVIFDPGRTYLAPPDGEKHEQSYNNEAALRPGYQQLLYTAQDTGCTVVFVHHWNKKEDGTTREKSSGSGVFRQVARHCLALAQIGDERALSVEKSNIIDRAYHVRSYTVDERPAHESAAFTLGGHLGIYRDLDEWIGTMKKLAKEGGPEIAVCIDWEEAAFHYNYLPIDAVAPSVENIAKDLGVTGLEARAIRASLTDHGVIHGTKWAGQPAANRAKPDTFEDPNAD